MPLTDDYAEKKIAEYLDKVAASLSDLPEAERSRLLRNAESEIRSQLHKRNPGTPSQWDVDVVLAGFPPPSRNAHAPSGATGPAKRNAHERHSSPLATVAGLIFVLTAIAILFSLLAGFWKTQPTEDAQEEQQAPPSNEAGDMEPGMKENPSDAPADMGPSEQPKLPEVFSLTPAAIRVVNGGSIRKLQKGCLLYSDKDVTMKEYPKKIAFTAMNYVKAPFGGCAAICTADGALLAIGIYDVHQQEQTDRIRDYLVRNEWFRVEESPRFVLFYTNGADRMGELYWKKVAKGDEMDFPPGMLLCFVPLTASSWSEQWKIVENEQEQNVDLATHHPMGWIDVDLPPDTYCNRPVWEGAGKHNGILAIHPLSTLKPARLSYIGKVNPATPILSVNACGNAGAGGDFLLQCVVNNNKIGEFVVDATRWRLCEFDLSASLASSPDPVIEIWGAAGGEKLWSFEHGYIDSIQFSARGADAPKSNGVLVIQNALALPEELDSMTLSLGQYGGHANVESAKGMRISGIHTASAAWPKVCVGPVYEMFFDCELGEGQEACWWLGGPGHGNNPGLGYVCRFNGKRALLSRDGSTLWEGDLEEPIAPRQRFGTLINRRQGRFAITVNGRTLLEVSDRDPLPASLHSWIGLGAIGGGYDSGVRYKSLSVRVPESCASTPMTLTPPVSRQCQPGVKQLYRLDMTGPGLPDTWTCSQPQAVKLDGKTMTLTGPNCTPECILNTPITGDFAIELQLEYLSNEALNFSVPIYWAQGATLDRAKDPQSRLCFPNGWGLSQIEWTTTPGAKPQILAKTAYYAPVSGRIYKLRLERVGSAIRVFVDGGLTLETRLPTEALQHQGPVYAGVAQMYGGARIHALSIESLAAK